MSPALFTPLTPLTPLTTQIFSSATEPGVPYTKAHPVSAFTHQRYRFVLSRVICCAMVHTDPQTGDVQRLTFYKDGAFLSDGLTWNPIFDLLRGIAWNPDYNLAFWDFRRECRLLAAQNSAYAFSYDAGLQNLLASAYGPQGELPPVAADWAEQANALVQIG